MIEVLQLTKHYGSFIALDRVSFAVGPGEIFGLVGPNGAGKTTLIKCMMGIVNPTSGSCRIGGFDVAVDGVKARRLAGYLPGDGHLYESMTPRVFLQYALDGYGSVNNTLCSELFEVFKIPGDRRIRSFSHGMKRKIGIIQALAPETPIVILDEPEEGLDPTARQLFLNILISERSRGRTIFLSSHQLDTVAKACDRVAFVAGGRLLDCDTMEQIRNRAGRRIRVRLQPGVDPQCLRVEGVESVVTRGTEYVVIVKDQEHEVFRRLALLPVDAMDFRQLRLEELYSDLYQVERPS